MKNKLLIWILVLAMTITPVLGVVEVQISDNNQTWSDVNTTLYGGTIDETDNVTRAEFLEMGKHYYLRARDGGGDWAYEEFNTDGSTFMSGAVLIVMGMLALVFGYLTVNFRKTIALVPVFSLLTHVAVIFFLMSSVIVVQGTSELDQTQENDFVSLLELFYGIAIITFFVHLILAIFIILKLVIDGLSQKRRQRHNTDAMDDFT